MGKKKKKKKCIWLDVNMLVLCVKNPELQPPAVHTREGFRWTQVPPSAVSIGGNADKCRTVPLEPDWCKKMLSRLLMPMLLCSLPSFISFGSPSQISPWKWHIPDTRGSVQRPVIAFPPVSNTRTRRYLRAHLNFWWGKISVLWGTNSSKAPPHSSSFPSLLNSIFFLLIF